LFLFFAAERLLSRFARVRLLAPPQKLLKDLAPCGFVVALTVLWSDQKWFKQMALFDDEHALTIRAPKKLARPC
jgi:hypothetical protein